jgi:hypothetical protein
LYQAAVAAVMLGVRRSSNRGWPPANRGDFSMKTGDDPQEPRPEEKDEETSGPETATQPRSSNSVAHRFTARATADPDDPDQSGDDDTEPKIGARRPTK